VRAVTCPGCGASIPLRALGQSVMVACPSCQSTIDVSQPEIRLIQKFNEEARRLRLALGTRGTLRGQALEVVGAMGRSANGYAWEEYLLFSPYLGFRWLVFDQGHWNFGKAIKDSAGLEGSAHPVYEGHNYRWAQGGQATVDWVLGEFYWRVRAGDVADTTDYAAPPYLLSREEAAGEVTWTLLSWMDPAEIDAAFHIATPPPAEAAVNQPNPYRERLQSVRRIVRVALALALVLQALTWLVDRSTSVPLGVYTFDREVAGEEQVFGPITLRSGRSLNELSARAELDNNWIELECALVNDTTGEVFRFENNFEFYTGSDSDGAWSEGGRNGSTLVTEIPAGSYHLVVSGSGGAQNGQPAAPPVSLTLRHDVVPWRNFWLAVLAILAYPAYLFLRGMKFEQERWDDGEGNSASALVRRLQALGGKES
jgi:hypothetical protein